MAFNTVHRIEATLAVGQALTKGSYPGQDHCHASSTLHRGCRGSLAGKWRCSCSFFCEALCLLSTPLQWCRHRHSLPQEGGPHCRGSAGKDGSIAALQRLILLEQKVSCFGSATICKITASRAVEQSSGWGLYIFVTHRR